MWTSPACVLWVLLAVLYPLFCSLTSVLFALGVMLAVDAIIAELKKLSKPVTTPEEIAQVKKPELRTI